MKKLSRLIIGIFVLSGCASANLRETPPEDAFSIAEYSSIKLDEGTYRIVFFGKSVTANATSADFARLQSAAIATKNGYKYFMISKYFVTSPGVTGTAPDNTPASSDLPMNTLIVQCFNDRPADARSAVYDASEISKRIRAQYKL